MSGDRPPTIVLVVIGVGLAVALGVMGLVVYGVMSQSRAANEPCPLCDAVATKDPEQVEAALASDATVSPRAWRDAIDNLQGFVDARGPEVEIARMLAEHGGDPNVWWSTGSRASRSAISSAGGQTWAAAVLAMAADRPELVDALIAHGLEVSGRPGGEALVGAAAAGHARVVARLLKAGVPPNYKSTAEGVTPLALAIQTGNIEVIAAIEQAGGREW
jgi:hypothetical protein